ncbi:hypothetical protein O3P69_008232 [Scylla paramamosain]|uniref:Uncharacterized protein n=1 Tax=Scylla paramamosain TaxID=85552 RepID=A0AAW0T1V7_SCYPA
MTVTLGRVGVGDGVREGEGITARGTCVTRDTLGLAETAPTYITSSSILVTDLVSGAQGMQLSFDRISFATSGKWLEVVYEDAVSTKTWAWYSDGSDRCLEAGGTWWRAVEKGEHPGRPLSRLIIDIVNLCPVPWRHPQPFDAWRDRKKNVVVTNAYDTLSHCAAADCSVILWKCASASHVPEFLKYRAVIRLWNHLHPRTLALKMEKLSTMSSKTATLTAYQVLVPLTDGPDGTLFPVPHCLAGTAPYLPARAHTWVPSAVRHHTIGK